MSTTKHMVIGAAIAAAPDLALFAFGWRRTWLKDTHPLVRTHRWLHSPSGAMLVAILAYGSHLVADSFSNHRKGL